MDLIYCFFLLSLILGDYHCPITFKVFNENSHIVAIRTSGNVYCYEVRKRVREGGRKGRRGCLDLRLISFRQLKG